MGCGKYRIATWSGERRSGKEPHKVRSTLVTESLAIGRLSDETRFGTILTRPLVMWDD